MHGLQQRGLKMFNIKTQISAVKLTWLRRLFQNQNSDYHLLCTYNIKSLEKLLHMGSLYCAKIIDKTSNKFRVDILYKWKRILHNQMGSAQSCLTCPLWYNPNISKETLFLPQCYRAEIIYPIDLCNREGNMLTLEEVRKNYHVNLHFLDYYRLQSDIEKLIKTQGTNSQNLIPEKPIWLATLSLIHKSKKGCKDLYEVLRQKSQDSPSHTKKWEKLLQINLEPKDKIYI